MHSLPIKVAWERALFSAAVLWNGLPTNLKTIGSLASFKTSLKNGARAHSYTLSHTYLQMHTLQRDHDGNKPWTLLRYPFVLLHTV